jgi:hypothetical protein
MVGIIQSPAPVTKWELFFLQKGFEEREMDGRDGKVMTDH